MLRRGLIITAASAYIIVLLVVLTRSHGNSSRPAAPDDYIPEPAAPGAPLTGLPYRSIGMQIQRVDWIDRYKASIDKIADLGADTILLVVDSRMENGKASHVYLDLRTTPTVEQLGDLIDRAKARKLRVILMPIVLLDKPLGNEWRGTIAPESWDDWWDSYRDMMTHFASIALVHHVDVLVVGSELVSTENRTDEWARTIGAVRGIYKGQLTYSSNWDHYTAIRFWNQLDIVGMNSYWKFTEDPKHSPTVDEIVKRWREIQGDLVPWLRKVNKPLLFTEVGWFSQHNVAYEPWDYTKDEEPLDLDIQKRLYEGFFKAWVEDPKYNRHLGGFSMWEWPPDKSGPEDRGYTPQGKPAEQVLRDWFAKPRWEIK